MLSSDGFGGGATGARPRVQVCPTVGAESGTVLTTQQEMGRDRKRQLFPGHDGYVDARGPERKRIEFDIVGGVGIG